MFQAELAFRNATFHEAARRTARHILHLDASHGPTSIVGHGANALFEELGRRSPELHMEHVRLWQEDTRSKLEYNLEHVRAKMARLAGNGSSEDEARFAHIEALAAQVASARGLVVSAPLWNYGPPYVLKQYFDCVLHPGLTFREAADGPRGLVGNGRPLVLITSSGGAGTKDYLTPWLLDVAAMMGFDDARVVSVPNASHAERQTLLDGAARAAIDAAVHVASVCAGAGVPGPQAPIVGDQSAPGEEATDIEDWSDTEMLAWIAAQGGVSEDGMESLKAAKVNGELFLQASDNDWESEELELEASDIARLRELQALAHGRTA